MKKIKLVVIDDKSTKTKYKKYPRLNIESMISINDEEKEKAQVEHIKKIRNKTIKYMSIPIAIITIALLFSLVLNFESSRKLEYCIKENSELSTERNKWKSEYNLLIDKYDLDASSKAAKKLQEYLRDNENKNTTTSQTQKYGFNLAGVNESGYGFKTVPNESETKTETKIKCIIPDCDNSPCADSFFCSSHECIKPGCHNQRANDYCNYCSIHKCAKKDCNFSASYDSEYCLIHKD